MPYFHVAYKELQQLESEFNRQHMFDSPTERECENFMLKVVLLLKRHGYSL